MALDTRGFFEVNWSASYRDDLRRPGTRSLSMTRLGEGLLEVRDPPVKARFIVPHQSKIRRGLQRPDLQISYGHLYISWNEPAVSAPGECLPSTEIFRRLARRRGSTLPVSTGPTRGTAEIRFS